MPLTVAERPRFFWEACTRILLMTDEQLRKKVTDNLVGNTALDFATVARGVQCLLSCLSHCIYDGLMAAEKVAREDDDKDVSAIGCCSPLHCAVLS